MKFTARIASTAALLAAALFTLSAQAQVTVKDAWVRATVPQQHTSGVFLQIASAGDARLVQVTSPLAEVAELHQMKMDGDIMKMSAVTGIDLPAGKTVALSSGGYHIMLLGLKQQLKQGDSVPLMLVVEGADHKREIVQVNATVRASSAMPAMKH